MIGHVWLKNRVSMSTLKERSLFWVPSIWTVVKWYSSVEAKWRLPGSLHFMGFMLILKDETSWNYIPRGGFRWFPKSWASPSFLFPFQHISTLDPWIFPWKYARLASSDPPDPQNRAMSGCILTAKWASIVNAIIISSSVGYGFSILTLVINALMEGKPPEVGWGRKKHDVLTCHENETCHYYKTCHIKSPGLQVRLFGIHQCESTTLWFLFICYIGSNYTQMWGWSWIWTTPDLTHV